MGGSGIAGATVEGSVIEGRPPEDLEAPIRSQRQYHPLARGAPLPGQAGDGDVAGDPDDQIAPFKLGAFAERTRWVRRIETSGKNH